MRTTLERELKLEPDPQFVLPQDLGRPVESRLFISTYYDTPPRSLLRSGLTLRRRVENGLSRWQLKLPREGNARAELESPGGPAGPPHELRNLLAAHLRHGPLAPVATLRTRRVGVRVGDGEHELAEVTLDAVDVLDGQRQAGAFRELEIELLEGDDDDLDRLARVLRRAGAHRSDGRTKVARALDLSFDGAPPEDASPFEQLHALLRLQLRDIEAHDPGVRLGDDPEDVHRMRVATRRTRALVQATRPLLGERLHPLADELKWIGALLGSVRDLDVLIDRLRDGVAQLDDDRKGGDLLVASLEEEREGCRDALLTALDSPRYLDTLALFEREVEALPRQGEADGLAPIAAEAFAKLRKQAKALPDVPSDAELHELRKSVKKARYAAELAAGEGGRRVEKAIDGLKDLQDVIGAHQDAVVAEERLRALAKARTALAAGRLIERERERRRVARAELPVLLDDVLGRGRKAFA
ncbi:MAG TPA: CYTH and CHAD domain-containing protein [Gaiellaceae bacterium]